MRCIQNANIIPQTKILVRMDLDVPIEKDKILEEYRLEAGLETLKYIISKGATPIIMGHMGKPKGIFEENLSTKKLLPYFEEKLGKNNFEILENLRFDKREEENSKEFAEELAKDIAMYINESFATCHREHTSIVAITKILPSYAGFRLQEEISMLNKVKTEAKKPFVVIIGGAKLESKKPVIETFLKIADSVLVGGKLGLEWDKEVPTNLYLPIDYATDQKDIGEKTIKEFKTIVEQANTILWAGPMGMYENENFMKGTESIIESINNNKNCWSIIGGGDTITALKQLGNENSVSYISTGGGAMLNYLAKGTLIGIEALKDD